MAYRYATWMADVLRRAGVPVIEEPGWQTRGRPDGVFEPRALVLHHDASPKGETSNGADVIINGKPGTPGPLAQLWLDYDGRWHLCAAGRANHAGEGSWPGMPDDNANSYALGLETDHTTNEQWTQAQGLSGIVGTIAICDYLGVRTDAEALKRGLFAHKEWAPDRKVDPDPLDMHRLRAVILDPPPLPEEGFMHQIRKVSTQAQTISKPGAWTALRLDEDTDEDAEGTTFGIVAGPRYFLLDVAVTTEDGGPGAVMLRAVNTEGDRDNVESGHPILQASATDAGPQHFGYHAQGHVPEGQWLRMQVFADEPLTATKVETRVTLW